MPASAPVERKVQASSAAAAASGLALWVLGRYVLKGSVPDVVTSWTYAAVPGVLAFAAGYYARHTARPVPSQQPVIAAGRRPRAADEDPDLARKIAVRIAADPLPEPEFAVQGLPPAAPPAPEPDEGPQVPAG